MASVIQWVCDRDGNSAQGEGITPPKGWLSMACQMGVEIGGAAAVPGVQGGSVELCPACVEAFAAWLGKPALPALAVGANVVPMEPPKTGDDPPAEVPPETSSA